MKDDLQAELVRSAEDFSRGIDLSGLPREPSRRLAVLTCMDARVDPAALLGLELGAAHVIRNAGGRATDDAIRSLAISTRLLGVRAIAVIHHTECGMTTFTNQQLWAELRDSAGVDATGTDFEPFADVEGSVRDDTWRIEQADLIDREVAVLGFVYDVRTGALTPVPGAGRPGG